MFLEPGKAMARLYRCRSRSPGQQVWQGELSLARTVPSFWRPAGAVSLPKWTAFRGGRNKLRSMLLPIQKTWEGEEAQNPGRSRRRDGWLWRCSREIQPRSRFSRKDGSVHKTLHWPLWPWVGPQATTGYVTLSCRAPFLSRDRSEGDGDISASYANRLWNHIIRHVTEKPKPGANDFHSFM